MLDAELIIFDCDGVLVDTEPLTNRVLAQCVTDAGWEVDTAYSIKHFKGRNLADILHDVETKLNRSLPDLLDEYRRRMYEAIENDGVPAIAGIHDLLDTLDAMNHNAPHRCVATNAPMKKATLTLTGAGLFDRFTHRDRAGQITMFSAYEIGKWKPDPGLFLHAAATMGHKPEHAIVIEDSVAGVHAAINAGMRVIGFADLTEPTALRDAGAHAVIESYAELLELRDAVFTAGAP
ncbi:MAG: HAD-IA family hydrolase [Phycisphaerales bacterium]|nr:HAD-IA family hydrolase [Phycisphaerales bacterium]